MIAFYTQSPEQIDEIFRQSALNRAKWEDRADYREMTIKKALVGLTSTWQLRQPRQHWQPESAFLMEKKRRFRMLVMTMEIFFTAKIL